GSRKLEWDDAQLDEIARFMQKYPIFITNTSADDPFLQVFDRLPEDGRQAVKGAVSVENWDMPQGYTQVRSLAADLWDVHHRGADAVSELALALAKAAELATTTDSFNEFTERFFVRFAVDTHFFMEIAKFRAFRVLWQAFCKAYNSDDVPNI